MSCQVEIARQLVAQGGDDVLSLQEPQPGVHRDGPEVFEGRRGPHPLDEAVGLGYDAQVKGGHGRIETRQVWCTAMLAGLTSCERGPGVATVVMVQSRRQGADHESTERRDHMRLRPGTTDHDAKRFQGVLRTPWKIANRLHWVLDVAMGEDGNRTRTGASAQPLA